MELDIFKSDDRAEKPVSYFMTTPSHAPPGKTTKGNSRKKQRKG
jgi:hypothetical protein